MFSAKVMRMWIFYHPAEEGAAVMGDALLQEAPEFILASDWSTAPLRPASLNLTRGDNPKRFLNMQSYHLHS